MGNVRKNALQLERVKTIRLGKSSTLMLLGDVFGVEMTTVDKVLQKSTRVFVPRPVVVEMIQYFSEVLEATKEEEKKEELQGNQEELCFTDKVGGTR